MRLADRAKGILQNNEATFRTWIQNKQLIHPLATNRPSTIEFFCALRDICGPAAMTTSAATEMLESRIGEAQHYVVIVVDGLGDCFRNSFLENGFFDQAEKTPLVTGAPSSTAPMLTSFATGTWPGEHGITGWHTYFQEVQRSLTVLPFSERTTCIGGQQLDLSLHSLVPEISWYPSRNRKILSILPKKQIKSHFSRWARGDTEAAGYSSLKQAQKRIIATVRCHTEPSLTYCYVPTIDRTAHRFGCTSLEVNHEIESIDIWLQELRNSLPNTARLLVLADHGLIDTPADQQYIIRDNDTVMRYLSAPPSGEAAMPVFHVIPGYESEFPAVFSQSVFSKDFILLSNDQINRLNLFGPDPLSAIMRMHLGNYIGIAKEPAALYYASQNHEIPNLKAIHGGLRKEEMFVTLYTA